MSSAIRVPIPPAEDDLRLYFDEMVDNDAFGLALDYSVAEFDERARLTEIAVTSVEASETGVAVHYTVSWDAFHPCDDRVLTGQQERTARGHKVGNEWLFEPAEPPVARSPADEL